MKNYKNGAKDQAANGGGKTCCDVGFSSDPF
jgi:hypothetical protein